MWKHCFTKEKVGFFYCKNNLNGNNNLNKECETYDASKCLRL